MKCPAKGVVEIARRSSESITALILSDLRTDLGTDLRTIQGSALFEEEEDPERQMREGKTCPTGRYYQVKRQEEPSVFVTVEENRRQNLVPRTGNVMSTNLLKNAQLSTTKLIKLLNEVRNLDLSPPNQLLPWKNYANNMKRKNINTKWFDYISTIPSSQKKKDGEDKYAQMVDDGKGILHLITEGIKAVVVLEMYKKDFETIIEQTKTQPKESTQQDVAKTASLSTINLPQLPLPTFSGDPKTWREFWSSFEAA
uniref:Gag_p10 domain-containing protein n=1 Tax=Loa loa TaxID=7209 RepID=A0A1I7VHG0_LOALO